MIAMQPINFIEAFIEIFIAVASSVIVLMIISILFIMRRVDKGLFRARLFLNETVMQRTWIYISIAGAAFAINTLIMFLVKFGDRGELFSGYYLPEITQIIFLLGFIFAVFSWHEFIGSFHKHKGSAPQIK